MSWHGKFKFLPGCKLQRVLNEVFPDGQFGAGDCVTPMRIVTHVNLLINSKYLELIDDEEGAHWDYTTLDDKYRCAFRIVLYSLSSDLLDDPPEVASWELSNLVFKQLVVAEPAAQDGDSHGSSTDSGVDC